MGNTSLCSECGATVALDDLRADAPRDSGKRELACECGNVLTVEYYCERCDVVHTNRDALQQRTNGGVTELLCPECFGWYREDVVLAVQKPAAR